MKDRFLEIPHHFLVNQGVIFSVLRFQVASIMCNGYKRLYAAYALHKK